MTTTTPGRRATDGRSTGGRPTDGRSTDGRSTDGRSTDGRPTDGPATCGRRPGDGGVGGRVGDDRGAVTVLAATAVGVLALLLVLGLALGAAVVTRHRAEQGADLAALAAAADAVRGRDVACGRATAIAAANGARLAGCTWSGWAVEVRVEASCRCLPSVVGAVVARARAGPAG